MNNSIDEQKVLLRKMFSKQRSDIDFESKRLMDGQILKRLEAFECFKNAEEVLTYVSLPKEVDTIEIIKHILDKKIVAVPKVSGNTAMEFYIIDSLDKLKSGYMNISEPDDSVCRRFTGEKGVCLVPGLAFSPGGDRLGYGGGYYDRYLRDKELIKIGITYSCLLVNKIPSNENDVKMNYILTENGVIKCS